MGDKYCVNCGTALRNSGNFCHNCGSALEQSPRAKVVPPKVDTVPEIKPLTGLFEASGWDNHALRKTSWIWLVGFGASLIAAIGQGERTPVEIIGNLFAGTGGWSVVLAATFAVLMAVTQDPDKKLIHKARVKAFAIWFAIGLGAFILWLFIALAALS